MELEVCMEKPQKPLRWTRPADISLAAALAKAGLSAPPPGNKTKKPGETELPTQPSSQPQPQSTLKQAGSGVGGESPLVNSTSTPTIGGRVDAMSVSDNIMNA